MRVLSGTQPSGDSLHIGNYFGAIQQYLGFQEEHEALYFIADYHSMNSVRDAKLRREYTRSVALDYLACGIDPSLAVLFRQSDTPEVCEFMWLLSSVTPMGLLERGHAYKDKLAQGQSSDHGLFAYPVLMAADILLYHADVVPVGQDQKQHLEMTRDMAQHFNQTYGVEVLKLPDPYILKDVAVVPGTDGRKMSKSYANTVPMFASPKVVQKAVMGVVTDSTPLEDPKDPEGVLFQLYNLFADESERLEMAERARAGGLGYGHVKKELLTRLNDCFAPMRQRRVDYEKRPDYIEDILRRGAEHARSLGIPVLDACRQAAGVGARR
jgi:tryptophanyl-tRNA synthetase